MKLLAAKIFSTCFGIGYFPVAPGTVTSVVVAIGEIEALEDFSFNLGYVIGPISAGILSDMIGITGAFTALGMTGFVVAIILIKVTPKSIRIKT